MNTARVGEAIDLCFDNGHPCGFTWQGERWTVTRATADAFEFLGDRTFVTGWHVAAQVLDGSDAAQFEVARDHAANTWSISSLSFA